MIGLRSLRNRLAVVFGLIVLGAIGTIYLTVTPRLEERLQEQKLDRLPEDARRAVEGPSGIAVRLPSRATDGFKQEVASAAARSSAEVIVLNRRTQPTSVTGVVDSQPEGGLQAGDISAVALEAVNSGRPIAHDEATPLGRRAVVAYPLMRGKEVTGVAVFADALDEVEGNVALIRRQILLSGGIALVVALLAG